VIKDTQPSPPVRVLVVDDDPLITEVVSDYLTLKGFEAHATNDSSEVLDLLALSEYGLIILDINMPEPDGLTLLRQIHARDPFQAILMLTAIRDTETAVQAMQEGASDYIVKPHQEAQLDMRIERALERSLLLREQAHAHDLLEQRVDEQSGQLRDQSRQLSRMLDRLLVTYRATLRALEAALDVRDQSAPGHCRRVSELAVQLGRHMGYRGQDLVTLEYGALLHDIGKLGIEDAILMKPGQLTEDERETMKSHPEIGCQIVGHIDFLGDALPIIRHHHEHWDGTGYPDGLQGDEIPLLARIFSVVDVYDALTNQRSYNVVISAQDALDALYVGQEAAFDPQVVDAFAEMIASEIAEQEAREKG